MVRLSGPAREERTEERRSQILHAAHDVFSRKGFHGATIREIATTARVAEGTIYLYFASKQEVLKGVFALIAEEVAAQPVFEDGAGNDEAILTALMRGWIQALARHASFIRLAVHEADLLEDLRREFFVRLHDPFVAAFEGFLRERITRGVFRPVDAGIVASLCFRMVMSHVMVQRVLELDHPSGRYDDETYVAEVVALVLYGLTAGRRAG
jgi:AcrR family transcriptional regulator